MQSPSLPIEFVDFESLPRIQGDTCLVSVRGNLSDREREQLRPVLLGFKRRVCLLRFAPESTVWQIKQVFKELRSPFYRLMTEIWTEDVHLRLMRVMLRKRHRFFGALPSQRCSLVGSSWSRLTAPVQPRRREHLFAYSGSWNANRDKVTSWVEERLKGAGNEVKFGDREGRQGELVIWHNDRPGERLERSFEGYVEELESSWFCLCLPGYTGTTNRALEAVLRGAIPVIQEEQVPFHGLPLRDGVNAVFVSKGDWPSAISRLPAMPMEQRAMMQRNVIELAQAEAKLENLMARLLSGLQATSPST